MDLKALRYFEFVAQLKSFSKAAVHLRVAQSALSRQVQKLENELGVQLVRRNKHGIELTDAGAILLQRSRVLNREVVDIVDDVRAQGKELHGAIRIGAPPTIGDLILPPVFIEAANTYPSLRLAVVEGASPIIYEQLLTREVTLGILHNPEPHQDLVVEPMLIDYLYVVGPAREMNGLKPVAKGQPLQGLPMILPRPPYNRRLLIDKFCIAHGLRLDVKLEVDGFTITRAMVENGIGYSILSYYGVHQAIASNRLSGTKISHPEMPWELCLAYRRDLSTFRPMGAMIELIRRQTHALFRQGSWWPEADYVPARRKSTD